jgi:hypothetical protein
MTDRLPDEELDQIRDRALAATQCSNKPHVWKGDFTHVQCTVCRFSRPRGERAEETIKLLTELDRVYDLFDRLTAVVGALDFDRAESGLPETQDQWIEFVRGIDECVEKITDEY